MYSYYSGMHARPKVMPGCDGAVSIKPWKLIARLGLEIVGHKDTSSTRHGYMEE